MRTPLILLFSGLLVLFVFYGASRTADLSNTYSLTTIEVADEPREHEQGLSGRRDIPDDYGMLFIFDRAEFHGFWMKDMYESIDIIWVQQDGTIASMVEAASPDTYPKVFYPPVPVSYVLEVRSGLARERGWATSTQLSLPLR